MAYRRSSLEMFTSDLRRELSLESDHVNTGSSSRANSITTEKQACVFFRRQMRLLSKMMMLPTKHRTDIFSFFFLNRSKQNWIDPQSITTHGTFIPLLFFHSPIGPDNNPQYLIKNGKAAIMFVTLRHHLKSPQQGSP